MRIWAGALGLGRVGSKCGGAGWCMRVEDGKGGGRTGSEWVGGTGQGATSARGEARVEKRRGAFALSRQRDVEREHKVLRRVTHHMVYCIYFRMVCRTVCRMELAWRLQRA